MSRVSIAPSERHGVDYLADLYTALLALEKLEKAHHRDLVTPEQYAASLRRLLEKYANIAHQLRRGTAAAAPGGGAAGVPGATSGSAGSPAGALGVSGGAGASGGSAGSARVAMGAAEIVGRTFLPGGKGIDAFLADYAVNCPGARTRLLQAFGDGGIPPIGPNGDLLPIDLTGAGGAGGGAATPAAADGGASGAVGSGASNGGSGGSGSPTPGAVDPKIVLEVGQHFITLMDCVKLQQTAADQLAPILTDLLAALRRVAPDFEALPRLQKWWDRLGEMHATDVLDERDTRALAFDLERGYQAFHHFLQGLSDASRKK